MSLAPLKATVFLVSSAPDKSIALNKKTSEIQNILKLALLRIFVVEPSDFDAKSHQLLLAHLLCITENLIADHDPLKNSKELSSRNN